MLPDGTINLPRIGEVSAKGKTIEELKEILIKKYKLILKAPIIYIDLAYTRPIRVMITGEVNVLDISRSLGLTFWKTTESGHKCQSTIKYLNLTEIVANVL